MKESYACGHPGDVQPLAPAFASPEGARVEPSRITSEALFRMHAAFVAAFVARLGVGQEAVDDIVQDVFLAAHKLGGHEVGQAKPTTWLAEIALRIVSTHKRTERRRRVVPDEDVLDQAVATSVSPHDAAEHRAALGRVQLALDGIEVGRRAVFILFELLGESCDDIAEGLGIPVGTVHSRLFAARREFQKAHERLLNKPLRAESRARGGSR